MNAELIKTVQDLIGFVKDVSPEIWEILVWQQYVVATCWVIAFIFSGILLGVGVRILAKKPSWAMSDGINPGGIAITSVAGFAFGFISIFVFAEALPRLLNPEYYALMALKP